MATFSDIRHLLRNMGDIDFLSSLSNIDCYGKRVMVKPAYWNLMMSVIKQHVELRSKYEALVVARRLKQVYIERLALVSARSFKRFFIQQINSKFVEFEIAFTSIFEQPYIDSNAEVYEQLYEIPEYHRVYEEAEDEEGYQEIEKEEEEEHDEWAQAYAAYRESAQTAHVARGVHRNIYVKGKWYSRSELMKTLKEKKLWTARRQYVINNMTEASTWFIGTLSAMQHGQVWEDIGDGQKRLRTIRPRKEISFEQQQQPNVQQSHQSEAPMSTQQALDHTYETMELGENAIGFLISVGEDPYAIQAQLAGGYVGEYAGLLDDNEQGDDYEGLGTFE